MAAKFLQLLENDGLAPGMAEVHDYCGMILGIGSPRDMIDIMSRDDAYQLICPPDLYDYFCRWIGRQYLLKSNLVKMEKKVGCTR